ncbi:hypothetical protein BC829DRAFT_381538 [Chytridium lagenaria]|nr:hypothetical protein BC829DRAFT_381538 [Chytridium lagenaria]
MAAVINNPVANVGGGQSDAGNGQQNAAYLTPDSNVPRSMARADSTVGSILEQRSRQGSQRHSRRTTSDSAADPERETILNQALDIQDILRGMIERVEQAKDEHSKQFSENAVLLKYINNLMATDSSKK